MNFTTSIFNKRRKTKNNDKDIVITITNYGCYIRFYNGTGNFFSKTGFVDIKKSDDDNDIIGLCAAEKSNGMHLLPTKNPKNTYLQITVKDEINLLKPYEGGYDADYDGKFLVINARNAK